MRSLLCALLFACLLLPAFSQRLPLGAPGEVGLSAERLAEIGTAVQRYIDEKQLAGTITMVARRGKVVHFEARGMRDIATGKPMEKDTIFRIYSMTKAIVSVGVMMLCEEGKLELDAPASKYIPAIGEMKVAGAAQRPPMTVRDILRHTGGFQNNTSTDQALRKAGHPALADSTLEEMMNRMGDVSLRYQPGTDWYYSFGADVLARLIEIGGGKSVDAWLAEKVFEPLGMVDTAFHVPEGKRDRFSKVYGRDLQEVAGQQGGTSGAFSFLEKPKFLSGGGGLCSTATDYMRFLLMLDGMGELQGKRLLKAETVRAMTRNQLPDDAMRISRAPKGRGFGLGFAVRVETIDSEPSSIGEYEWLGGAGTEFWVSPADELVVITLSQAMPMRDLGRRVKPLVYRAIAD